MIKRISIIVSAFVVAFAAFAFVANPLSAAPINGTSTDVKSVVLGETDPGKLPVGVTVQKSGGVVTPNLGGCFNNEICVWTDSLGPSQPAGFLYRWDISYRGTTIYISPGTYYYSVSFMQNRQATSRARMQYSCPTFGVAPYSIWLYDEQYDSFAGEAINDSGSCIISQWV